MAVMTGRLTVQCENREEYGEMVIQIHKQTETTEASNVIYDQPNLTISFDLFNEFSLAV